MPVECRRHSTLAAPKGALLHSGSPRILGSVDRRSARCVEQQQHHFSTSRILCVGFDIGGGGYLGGLPASPRPLLPILTLALPISLSQPLQFVLVHRATRPLRGSVLRVVVAGWYLV